MTIRVAFAVAASLALAGCPLTVDPETLRPPSIVAAVPSWGSGDPDKTFTATLDAGGSAFEIVALELQLARDRDAARFASGARVRFPVASTPAASGPLSVAIPSTTGFVTAQLVTFEWVVEYRPRGGGISEVARSGARTFRVDCPANATRDFLASLQASVRAPAAFPQTLRGAADTARLASLGYTTTHGWRSFPGMGVAVFRLSRGSLTPSAPLDPSSPSLLLYAPNAGAASVTDSGGADYPYALIGFGFGQSYAPGSPPGLGCLPREAWFVHEAGWHLPNGGFGVDPPPETTLGEATPAGPSSLPPPSGPGIGAVPPWHGRLWDVHLFIDVAAGVPIVVPCFNAPATQPDFHADLSTCGVLPGRTLFPASGTLFPAAGFFTPSLPPP